MNFYPLLFEQRLLEKVWGGHSIHAWKYGKHSDQPIGESWEIFSGNCIVNGEYAGSTLQELIAKFPFEMTGRNSVEEFPLLVKLLDAKEWLSVQVHPDDALAFELEGEQRGKTECWYILEAEEGACIQYDLKQHCTTECYAESIQQNKPKDCLNYLPVQAGDIIYVPAGTVHAIGPGIMLYELQQTSDTTYRLYDWDRMGLDGMPRELHIEKGLKCSRPGAGRFPYPLQEVQSIQGNLVQPLIREQYFQLDLVTIGKEAFSLSLNGKASLLTNIGSQAVQVNYNDTMVILPKATSAFLPAALELITICSEDRNQDTTILIASEHVR